MIEVSLRLMKVFSASIHSLFWVAGCWVLAFSACKNDPAPRQTAAQDQHPELSRLTAMIEKNPANDSLYYMRGYAYWKLDAFDEAIMDANHAIGIDSMVPEYYHLLADAYLDYSRPNDSRRALDVLEKACTLFPDDALTWLKTSEFLLIVRQHGEALKKLDHILVRDPQNAEAYFMSGRIALDMNDTTRAVKSFQKSVQLDADNKDAWTFLGRIYTNKGNPLAVQFFDNALRIDSTDLEVREYKAAWFKRSGDTKRAFEEYRRIVNTDINYANAWFDMGVMYLDADSLQRAWEHFDRSVKSDPLFVLGYYYRGVASEAGGNVQAAIADYQQAYKMSPNLPDPKAALERLNALNK